MSNTQLDASMSFGLEGTYGTPVTPTRSYEFTDETFDWQPSFVQGKGLRVGTRVDRSGRRALGKQGAGGDLTIEAASKGMGFLWNAALGTSVSTLVSTGIYQQIHTPIANDYLPSYTIQKGVPLLGGSITAQTYAGCQAKSFELSVSTGGILTLKTAFMAKGVDTSTAYTAATYAAAPVQIFTFVGGAITIGGTVTLPTTTALATGGTSVGDIRDWSLSWDNKLDDNGYTFGNSGKRGRPGALGLASGTGKVTAEFDSTILRDAYFNQTDLAMVMTFQAQNVISASVYPTIQVVIPEIRLEGEMPKANKGDVITQSIGYTVLDAQVAASPIYIVQVTPDSAV
uniref:Uncharacterized protein n=1 Tax=uncultured organism TaxID=155900 RepID=A0A7L9QD25_9ZZZZ|nr:hypothetical protein [uncultured organism]